MPHLALQSGDDHTTPASTDIHASPDRVRDDEIRVLVTGFGPWGTNTINPSHLIVSSLPSLIPPTSTSSPQTATSTPCPNPPIRIITHSPLKVSYSPLPNLISHLLANHRPDLVLHLGLDNTRPSYNLEQSSSRANFPAPDVDGTTWSRDQSRRLWPEVDERMVSSFRVEEIRARCGLGTDVDLRSSDGVGNFLCAFCYYTTLAWYEAKEKGGERPVLFLHVPTGSTGELVSQGREVTIRVIQSMVAVWLEQKAKGGTA